MSDFLRTMKTMADQLVAIGHSISVSELILYTLWGLPSSYENLATTLSYASTNLTFDQVRANILTYDQRLKQKEALDAVSNPSVLYASSSPHPKREHSFASVALVAPVSLRYTCVTTDVPDQFPSDAWYPNFGASHHMTSQRGILPTPNPYGGSSHVFVGNGSSLPITHSGNLSLRTYSSPLKLHNVLHIPDLTHNLLSVRDLCLKNDCIVTF
ncbi:hypothetical protein MLD38_038586 [Melastoma candidum]|uniref:Uncharacterized protein n=1 Tax=Melastoma candidum TaxID=119954 RepID=A0ACB9KZC9_9MYRT|nr:hypothetical protein MLD38_038586 [Melastoma candidum]